jgi:hypothetical protein
MILNPPNAYLQALRKLYPEKVVIFEGKLVKSIPILCLAEPIPAAPELTMEVLSH